MPFKLAPTPRATNGSLITGPAYPESKSAKTSKHRRLVVVGQGFIEHEPKLTDSR
jgi:hypothetical protein